jgi:lysophospholipase L1-like esterase
MRSAVKGEPLMVARRTAGCLALVLFGGLGLLWASGVVFWLTLGVVMVGLAGVLLPVQSRRARFAAIALVIGSVAVGLALLETGLWLWETVLYEPLPAFDAETARMPLAPDLPPEIRTKVARMQSALIMPPDWQKRDLAKLPGTDPYMWHGVLHQIDANGMRREEPFPPRDPARFRIIVVGDSLTYGEGIDAYWAYPAQLERLLARDFQVEVLNLGVRGYGSEDIRDLLQRFLPELEPDLVVYGVCLNDFLERGGVQQDPPAALPRKLMKILTKRTRVGRLFEERSAALVQVLAFKPDFYGDLLANFGARYRRFGNDVAAMNHLVRGSGLPPMVAMVLDQGPRLGGRGQQLALAAERQLRAAGIETVPSEDFYCRYDGRSFRVSRWEGHPNEEAHAIWASELAATIRRQPELARFRHTAKVAHGQQR